MYFYRLLMRWVLILIVSSIVSFFVLEILLKVYNPFQFRVQGGGISLPVYAQYCINNDKIRSLDTVIMHTKNSLGFRGEDPPQDFKDCLSILTIGGSSTECFYLSDNTTWTDILGKELKDNFNKLWINNAGLDGHSTFGHLVLLKDHIMPKVRPKVILFLIGQNDVAREVGNVYDKSIVANERDFGSGIKGYIKSLTPYSKVVSTALNVYRFYASKNKGVGHNEIDLLKSEYVDLSQEYKKNQEELHEERYLKPYERRLNALINFCLANGIEPVLMTEPVLYGEGTDDVTKVDLSKIKIGELNGEVSWAILELYNGTTRNTAKAKNVLLIDLAREMPKSSRYYYDYHHYTKEGAKMAASIIYGHLWPFLEKKFPQYRIKALNIPKE